MASNMVVFDPSEVRFDDIDQRRKIIQSHYEAIGWTNEELNHKLRQRVIEDLCNMFNNRPEGFLKVGHVLFEYLVDQGIWNEVIKRREEMELPAIEWPWTRGPGGDDDSMGISATYHEWRKRNGHELPKDEKPQTVPHGTKDQSRIRTRATGGSAAAIAKSRASDKAFANHMAEQLVLKIKMAKMMKDTFNTLDLAMNNKSAAARVVFDEEVASIKAVTAKKRNPPMSLAEGSATPILPDPVTLPVRVIPGCYIDPKLIKAEPAPWDLRVRVWNTIMGQGIYQAPCIGPFEVAVPTWLNLHGLIWGRNGRLYVELRSSLPRFLSVDWISNWGKPKSLVVGFNDEEASKTHRHWQDLAMLYEVYAGTCTTLLESLTLSNWRRLFCIRRRQSPTAFIHFLSDRRKYDTTEAEALKRCSEEEVWTPQIYAILNQHSASAIEEPLRAWICREDGNKLRRATLATKVWVVIAASNQNTIQIFQALEWEHNFISSLSQETNTEAPK
ncbi:hypothetical protein NW752_006903 [Fusarium irregulare]|uniref:Uncharacterized protein n=1 Tax=Fusarium irregulare TaxID=2494466 RepID=A0A9W8PRV4_9HYPO|nr:hypothetical protein NW766_005783 [Fusarium irregulare]KAJ4015970.1 hypothetical protein NW752_006903 [Fusarium irregulare]